MVASWVLIALFAFLAVAHVVLAFLYYIGVNDQGYGYMFDWQWPAWSIVIIDAATAGLAWFAYRRGEDRPALGLILTMIASTLAIARAYWMVFIPVLVVIVLTQSIARVDRRGSELRHP
jgi:hypothetical protein